MSDSLFQSEFKIHKDLGLLSRALKNRWNIDPEKLKGVAEVAVQLTKHPDERIAIKACQVVAAMAAQEQKDDHKYLDMVSASQRSERPSVTSYTQIQVGDLESVYKLLEVMGTGAASDRDEVMGASSAGDRHEVMGGNSGASSLLPPE